MTRRYFYRCNDCLTVVASEQPTDSTKAVCNACGGSVEFMGRTVATGVLRRVAGEVAVCDGRCTHARGPVCDCPCRGENHGSGRTVAVYTDCAVPRIMIPADAVSKAESFRALCNEFRQKWEASYSQLFERKRYDYLPPHLFQVYLKGKAQWEQFCHARRSKTHAGREKAIKSLLGGIDGEVMMKKTFDEIRAHLKDAEQGVIDQAEAMDPSVCSASKLRAIHDCKINIWRAMDKLEEARVER